MRSTIPGVLGGLFFIGLSAFTVIYCVNLWSDTNAAWQEVRKEIEGTGETPEWVKELEANQASIDEIIQQNTEMSEDMFRSISEQNNFGGIE